MQPNRDSALGDTGTTMQDSKLIAGLVGPRQSGKTTLARSLLDERGEYLNWDIA